MSGTSEATSERVAGLEQAIDEARRVGDGGTEAALLTDASVAYLATGQVAKARSSLARALDLHQAAGSDVETAKVRYALALLHGRDPSAGDRAEAEFEAALEAFEAAGEQGLAARTRAHLATLLWREGRYADAATRLKTAEESFVRAGDRQHALEARRLRAFMLLLDGDAGRAYKCLSDAVADARQAGSETDLLVLEFDLRRLCTSGLIAPELRPPSLADLLRRADAAGQRRLAGHIVLSQAADALARRRIDEAQAGAESARRRALGGPDPILYLLACLLLAGIHEERGDDTGLLTILFTCQASLGDLLGDAGRRPVHTVVASVERRWGRERFARALAAYRRRVEQAGSP